jgi:cytochrome d ubiquinol oxidase subunit I
MLAIGFFMIGAAWLGALLWWRRKLFDAPWFLGPAQHIWWIGFVAIIAGWTVTESGRQPWLIYGALRTLDGISPVLSNQIATTLVLFVLVYAIVFSMGIYYINRLIENGPIGAIDAPPPDRSPTQTLASLRAAGRQVFGGR